MLKMELYVILKWAKTSLLIPFVADALKVPGIGKPYRRQTHY